MGTGEAVRKRRREFNERPEAINQFGQCMQLAQKAVDSFKAGDEKFNHLDVAEVEKVQKAIAEKQDWFSRMCADVSKLDKTSDPPVLASQFYQEKESFWHMASNILNKPKPKVEAPQGPPEMPGGPTESSQNEPGTTQNVPEVTENSPEVPLSPVDEPKKDKVVKDADKSGDSKVEPPPPPPTEPAKEEGMETEKGSESKGSEEAPKQKQAEM